MFVIDSAPYYTVKETKSPTIMWPQNNEIAVDPELTKKGGTPSNYEIVHV
jgi:hypothetical protein